MKKVSLLITVLSLLSLATVASAAVNYGTVSPTTQTICSGGTPGSISVSGASGGSGTHQCTVSYQWYSGTGSCPIGTSTWGTSISGATSSNYTPPALTSSTTYACWVTLSGSFGCTSPGQQWASGCCQVTVDPNFTAGAILTTGQTICYGGNPSVIGSSPDASGGDGTITYQWQSGTDGSTFPTTIASSNAATYTPPSGLTATTYYRRQAHDGTCNTGWTTSTGVWEVTVTPATAISSQSTSAQTQCINGSFSAVSVTATGTSLSYQWYSNTSASTSGGTSLGSSNGAQTSSYTPQATTAGTLYYYCIVSGSCGSNQTSAVSGAFVVNPATAISSQSTAAQTQCINGSFSAISVTATGTSLSYQWYSNTSASTSGGTSLGSANGAQTASYTPQATTAGTLYYYCTVSGSCGSNQTSAISGAFVVNTLSGDPTSATATTNPICNGGSTSLSLVGGGGGTGEVIHWYTGSCGGTSAGTGNSLSVSPTITTTYYGRYEDGAPCGNSACATVSVTVNAIPSAPIGSASQAFCSATSPTIASLAATGTAIQWYSASSGGSPLATSTALVDGTHYYASQTVNSCESSIRLDVTATVNTTPSTPTGTASQSFCSGTSPTVASLSATGTSIQWYAASSGGSPLSTSTALVDGTHYYASQTVSGCESSSRLDVTATVTTTPTAPTAGVTVQPTCATPTGTVTVTAPTGADYEYNINGGAYQASTTFTGVSAGANQVVLVRRISDNTCISLATTTVTVTAAAGEPTAPTASVTTQPTCAVATVTVTVTAPTGADYEYNINGGTYQASTTFTGVAAGANQVVLVRRVSDNTCISPSTTTVTVTAAAGAPTAPTASVTVQPTCAVATGSIVVSSPAEESGYEYSIDGTTYQSGATFTGVAAGTKDITVRRTTDNTCISSATTVTVDAQPATPSITGTTSGSRCGTGTVNLGATASAGTIKWYDAPTNGNLVGTGTSFTTPSISSTTNYYCDATDGDCTTASRTEVTATVKFVPSITLTSPEDGAYLATGGSYNWEWTSNGTPPTTQKLKIEGSGYDGNGVSEQSEPAGSGNPTKDSYTWSVDASNACGSQPTQTRTYYLKKPLDGQIAPEDKIYQTDAVTLPSTSSSYYYQVTMTANRRYIFATCNAVPDFGTAGGSADSDTRIYIYNSGWGTPVLSSDNYIVFPCTSGGIYYVKITVKGGKSEGLSKSTDVGKSNTSKLTNTNKLASTSKLPGAVKSIGGSKSDFHYVMGYEYVEGLPVELVSFDASGEDKAVLTEWQTASEIDIYGFNIWRSNQKDSGYVKINPSFIYGQGNAVEGASYSYVDSLLTNGTTYWYKLEEVDRSGGSVFAGPDSATPKVTGVDNNVNSLVAKLEIQPNPFNQSVIIKYQIPTFPAGETPLHGEGRGEPRIYLKIYDLSGRLVQTLMDKEGIPGTYTASWDKTDDMGNPVSRGKYFCVLKADGKLIKKLIYIKD